MEERKKKSFLIFIPIILLALGLFTFAILPSESAVTSVGNGLNYNAYVCIYKNDKLIECSPNVLYNTGKNMTRDLLSNPSAIGDINIISLCNATAGCGTPVADASEAYNAFTSCGLSEATATYSTNQNSPGNWSLFNTFTSTCNNREINTTRLRNASGSNFAGNSFTLVTLQNQDELTINWTLWTE